MKRAADMTAGEINRELDRLDRKRAKLNDKFISAGRGNEKPSETWALSDPLAMAWQAIAERQNDLYREINMRYGPGAPARLPRGFGPIKR